MLTLDLSDQTILVTGAAGTIGRALVKLLGENRATVRAQVRNSRACELVRNWAPNSDVRMLDFSEASDQDLSALVQGCTAVVHAAAVVHRSDALPDEYERVNAQATGRLAGASAEAGIPTFVFLSSIAVYGDKPYEHMNEDGPLAGKTPYAVSKLRSEEALRSCACPRTIVLRPPVVFGEGDRGNFIKLARNIARGRYFHIGGASARKSVIYSRDLAKGIVLALSRLGDGYHVFNVANPEPVTLRALTETLSECLDRKKNIASVPVPFVYLAAAVAQLLLGARAPLTLEQVRKLDCSTVVSVQKFVEAVGFAPDFSLRDGLVREIAWARAEGLL